MFTALYSIAKNTFVETLRQPIYAVIIVIAILLFILAPSVSMYTLDEDVKLLRELGLSTLFLAGLFIAVFSAPGAITEEIDPRPLPPCLKASPACLCHRQVPGIPRLCVLPFYGTAPIAGSHHGVMVTASDERIFMLLSLP
jgi:hypothetical protein